MTENDEEERDISEVHSMLKCISSEDLEKLEEVIESYTEAEESNSSS